MPVIELLHAFRSGRLKILSRLLLISIAIAVTYIIGVHFFQIQTSKDFLRFKLKSKHESHVQSAAAHQHVYYFKTHKTGSGTMCSIMADYIQTHHLLPLLPKEINFNQGGTLKEKQILLIDGVSKYDVVFSHHIFTPKTLEYLHNDTFLVTTLREPFSNFVSAFLYYRNHWKIRYLLRVPGDDPVKEFLNHPHQYETVGYRSWTNNRQSMDLGFDLTHRFDDIPYVKNFINEIEQQFHLVMIMEYFDEGLILMKRLLGWKTQDILYFPKNKGKHYKTKTKAAQEKEAQQRELHARFSQADIMLYDHFLNIFKLRMSKEVGLEEELSEFRQILDRVRDFCDLSEKGNRELMIPAGKWNNEFTITQEKCKWQDLECFQITGILQKEFKKGNLKDV